MQKKLLTKLSTHLWFSSVQFSHSVVSDSLQSHGLQHTRPPCPSPTPGDYTNSRPLSPWCHPTISSSVVSISSHLQSFPASESFLMSWLFTSGGQTIGASVSATILPMNIQGWFPLGLTSLNSLLSKRLLRVCSSIISSSVLSLLYGPTVISVYDYWKSYSFDYRDLCWQSNVSAF